MISRPVVAIVGRPNVGKSSLFNRITKKRIAVVHDQPGVTRDRNYADVDWNDSRFTIVDTGGLDLDPDDTLIDSVQFQVETAVDEAAVILFVVDAQTGILAQDLVVADKLRETDKPIFVVVNKSDNERLQTEGGEFYELGLADPFSYRVPTVVAFLNFSTKWPLISRNLKRIYPICLEASKSP